MIPKASPQQRGNANALPRAGYRPGANYVECYQRAISILQSCGDRYHEATSLVRFGEARLSNGDSGSAREAWALAMAILGELNHPDGDEIRARSSQLGPPTR